MRLHDIYETICECGKLIQTESREGKCSSCGRLYRLDWPAKELDTIYSSRGWASERRAERKAA